MSKSSTDTRANASNSNPTRLKEDQGERLSPNSPSKLTRRSFLGALGSATAAVVASGLGSLPAREALAACEVGPLAANDRADEALAVRMDAAQDEHDLPVPPHPCNGDEDLLPNRIGSFSKGLPHNLLGEVQPAAYNALLTALASGDPADFESIPMGSSAPRLGVQKLVNPQAGLAFDLEGADSHHLAVPPAPTFSSAEEAGEMAEDYLMALCRDVPFLEYGTNPLTKLAAASLSAFSDFRGPKFNGQVTPKTLFRGSTAGDLIGPYISQFLWRPAPYGADFVDQRMRTVRSGIDYMTDYNEWLYVQNGGLPHFAQIFQSSRRYINTGRDLSQWVHVDVLFQGYFNAMLILLAPPGPDLTSGGIGAPLNAGNPYLSSSNQIGFGTFGNPHIAALVCEVATRALKAAWYQKWFVHRRLRPEVFGGRIHIHKLGLAGYPIHPDILNSLVLELIRQRHGTYLLPMAFPEGCPMHPAYCAGHATVAGACVTVLKALFNENHVIPNPVIPHPLRPDILLPYEGPALTVGNELNKLAANVSIGRDFAGIHWRSDSTESLKLGEQVAISVLRDQRLTYNENFAGFTFTRFDGTPVTV